MPEIQAELCRVELRILGPGPVFVDFVSIFPEANGLVGSKTPFRQDLLQLLRGLQPKAIRLPGGCYVEGQTMESGFFWQPSVGPPEERPGHWNGPWRYWSTDGLGLFEYMQLAEELGAEAIWVVNNGVSHEESVETGRLLPLLEDTLASLEFIKGSAASAWGSLRAELGRPEPWPLNYLAIGNEDCGKPYYALNYVTFFWAVRELYPDMRLIANCHMGDSAPTDLWDWHWYTDSTSMFAGRTAFDGTSKEQNASIYASEYAVFDWGIATGPAGNLQGALAEAGFMTGMERNSHTVEMAAFAPLLVHIRHNVTCPNNLIVFDGSRSFGSPSYHVQALFSRFQGKRYLQTEVAGDQEVLNSLAASTVCLDEDCDTLAFKIVNFKDTAQDVALAVTAWQCDEYTADGFALSGSHLDSNSFATPAKVAPQQMSTQFTGQPAVMMPAWSFLVLSLRCTRPALHAA